MPKITQEQRNRYAAKVKEYKAMADGILAKEQSLLNVLKQPNAQGRGYVRVSLAEQMLVLTSYQILINSLSVSLLGIKNEDSLSEARKSVGRAIKYLEDIVTGYVDASFSEYEQNLEAIAEIPYEKRYALLRKIGFAIGEIEEGYGANSKWKWSFVELWGKYATVAKNLLDLKNLQANLDFSSQYRESSMNHLSLVKRQFQQAADRYREKYEIYSNKAEDFRTAILFLSALRRLNALLGERDDVEELKRKIEIWNAKLEGDIKKREERKER